MAQFGRMAYHKKLLMIGISSLSLVVAGQAALAEDFIDTLSMKRHAAGGPPPVPTPKTFLLAEPAQQFKQSGNMPKTTGVKGDVVNANRMVKVFAGYDGDTNAKMGGVQAKVMAPGVVVIAGARYEEADDYEDANGNKVKFGYTRDTEQFMIQWMPNPGGRLRLVGVRDVIKDDLQPHHGMDVDLTERLVGKALFDQKIDGDIIKGIGFEFASKNVKRSPDNYKNRDDGNPRNNLRAKTERHILEGKAKVKLNLGGWATTAAVNGGWDNQDARRYNDSAQGRINAIKLPDVTRTNLGFNLDGKKQFDGGVEVQAGVRYDYIHMDPNDAYKTGQMVAPVGSPPQVIAQMAAFNKSPAQLYQDYYGATGDFQRDDHNISARLRVSKSFLQKRFAIFGDLSRKVRSPDNIEAYHAVTHPRGQNQWIGNPNLDPEAHHKAEIGFVWKGANYKGYGKLGPNADGPLDIENTQIKLSGYVDYVDSFIAFDRARRQSGILRNDGALIHRNVDAIFAGVNFDARWNLTNNWSAGANVAYLWGNNESDNRALYQIAPLEANFLIDYKDMLGSVGTWNVGAKLRVVADQDRVDNSRATGLGMDPSKGKGFTTVDLYGGMQVGNRWSLSGGVNNLFNADYQEHITGTHVAAATKAKVNAPGRTFFVRSTLNF